MKKYIVITSIFPPTEAVKKFAEKDGWQLIVVGDKKTPEYWEHSNVIYLSPEEQNKIATDLSAAIPWNSYSRKMLGYAYAFKEGAEIIADTDDDNIPYENWGDTRQFAGIYETIGGLPYANLYTLFTDEHIWPRGYPLQRILVDQKITLEKHKQSIGVWQYLADEDPDVDAIYRLTKNTPVFFNKRNPIVLQKGTVCPFNSQNTFFRKELFPLLYLPAFVTFRFTDILRGLLAQPLMWQEGYTLGFGDATVIQKRNPHNYLKDFESEIPCYLYTEKVVDVAKEAIIQGEPLTENLTNVYKLLQKNGIVSMQELDTLEAWISLFI